MKDAPSMNVPMYQWDSVEAVDGAELTLRHLHSESTIALATGAAQSDANEIRSALHRVSLDGYVDKIYCFKNTGRRKPSLEFYQHIVSDLAARPEDLLMVGDSFDNDVLAANRAGIHAVWFNPKTSEDRTSDLYRTIHSLSQLLQIVPAKEKL